MEYIFYYVNHVVFISYVKLEIILSGGDKNGI